MNQTTMSRRWRTATTMSVGGFIMGAALLIAAPEGIVWAEGDGGCPVSAGGGIEAVLRQGGSGCPPVTTLPPETTVPPVTTLPPETTVPPVTTSPPETTLLAVTTLPPVTQPPVVRPPVAAGGPTTPTVPAPSKPMLPATGQNSVELVTAVGALAALLAGTWLVRVGTNRRPRPVR